MAAGLSVGVGFAIDGADKSQYQPCRLVRRSWPVGVVHSGYDKLADSRGRCRAALNFRLVCSCLLQRAATLMRERDLRQNPLGSVSC